MTDQPDSPETDTNRQHLLDQILDRTTRPVLLALYNQLNKPRPRHMRLIVLCGYVGSQLAYADDYIHFTLNISHGRKTVWRRHVRCHVDLLALCCPDLVAGDFLEIIGIAYKSHNGTEAVYIRRVGDEKTPLELFTDILEKLLGVQPGPTITNEDLG